MLPQGYPAACASSTKPVWGSTFVTEKEENEEIKVEDKRHFDREGNPVHSESESPKAQAARQASGAKEEPAEAAPESGESKLEKIDFVSILFSYVHTSLIYLGDLEDPISKKSGENLEGARQMIEILELMEQKTKGNLTQKEAQYLESALFDLRMRYMQKSKLIK
jgi:hypothetical protein